MDEHRTVEAPSGLDSLLDDLAETGEVTLTRAGRPVARLVPVPAAPGTDGQRERAEGVLRTFAELQQIAKTVSPRVTIEEIIAWKNEGRA